MKVVDDFFCHQDFIGNTKKISEYVKWATRFNGPAIWKTLTPMKIVCSPKSKDYIVCFLQSYSFFLSADFVLETTRHVWIGIHSFCHQAIPEIQRIDSKLWQCLRCSSEGGVSVSRRWGMTFSLFKMFSWIFLSSWNMRSVLTALVWRSILITSHSNTTIPLSKATWRVSIPFPTADGEEF